MLCAGARREWLALLVSAALIAIGVSVMGWWWASIVVVVLGLMLLLAFRDPDRSSPSQRGVVVSAADGTVSSVHTLERLDPLPGEVVCVRTFLSLLNVHVVRMPCYGRIDSIEVQDGRHLSALNPKSVEENASVTLRLSHPTRREPVAVVRLIAGQFARTIRLFVEEGDTLQRGQRLGIILLGSTAEVYVSQAEMGTCRVAEGQKVRAGETVILEVDRVGSDLSGSQAHPPAEKLAVEESD